MWYPCNCTECNSIAADNFKNTTWVESEMGSFPVIHGFLSLSAGKMGGGGGGQYPEPTMGLQRSATCGYLPSHHFCPVKNAFDGQHFISSRLSITDGKVQDVEDDDDILKAKLTIHNGSGLSITGSAEPSRAEEGHKKSRDYSDDSLTPDSTLPPVIRRRNRNRRKKLATSMVEPASGGVPWEGETTKPPPRTRSQSISDDQWAQVMAAQTSTSTAVSTATSAGPACPPGHTPADMSAFAGATTRRGYNTITSSGRGGGGTLGRGMVSSASVCDLNTLAQQQPQPALNSTHAANSFQQLNMMGYGGGMVWGAPCDLCQVMPMYPGHPNATGMKRAASNLSMNLSSIGSDVSGYPWAPPPPHIHHHMPMYPGYYPGYHPHMAPPPMGSAMGLNMSIPDSMHTFSKVPSSPAPSVRSSSHRSHKSTKSRSFSAADTSGRRSRNRRMKRSEESEDSRSSSVSEDDDDDDRESKSCQGGGSSLAWQCDHCTFINSGGTRTCGMCSKTVGSCGRSSRRSSERRRSERRRDRRTDPEENDRDVSDYDNDGGGVVKSNLSFNIKDSKRESRTKVTGSNKGKSKKKSRRRGSSASASESKSEGEEEERLERHMRDLRVSSSSSRRRGSDHDGVNNKDKDRDRDRGSRKKEGKLRWKE